jgi:nucleoside-diphosphate-sugar epimerase
VRILLTGATGYIGSALLEHFVSKGEYVSIIVRQNSEINFIKKLLPNISVYTYSGKYSELNAAVKESKPNVVVHVASLFLAQHKSDDLHNLIESNIQFPTTLLEAMRENNIKYIINTGTSWQHYKNKDYDPVNLYAATKKAFEDMAEYYIQASGISCVTLKLFDTYGRKDHRKKLFYLLRQSALTGTGLNMSQGLQPLDLLYISDVINAYDCAIQLVQNMECGSAGFALSSGMRYSLKEIVNIYSQVVNRDIEVLWGGLPYREREVMLPWTSFHLLPNWNPKVDIRAGIQLMESDPSINGLLAQSKK